MSETAKLKAPKGTSAVSVLGQEYKVIKGFVTVAIEHVADLVGFGFTGADGEDLDDQKVDPSLPAGVNSNLVHVEPIPPEAGPEAPAPAPSPDLLQADPATPVVDPAAPVLE